MVGTRGMGHGTRFLLIEIQEHYTLFWENKAQADVLIITSMNMCLQLTTEVTQKPTKAPGCLAYSLNLNDICPLRVTTDITLYDIIMQILNI